MNDQHTKKQRTLRGVVVSDKMQKTVVVRIDRIKKHPKYERRYRVSKKYKAHDEKGEFHIGDKVLIGETRPLSRDKKWQVLEKIGHEKVLAALGDAADEIPENTLADKDQEK